MGPYRLTRHARLFLYFPDTFGFQRQKRLVHVSILQPSINNLGLLLQLGDLHILDSIWILYLFALEIALNFVEEVTLDRDVTLRQASVALYVQGRVVIRVLTEFHPYLLVFHESFAVPLDHALDEHLLVEVHQLSEPS